MRDADGIRLDTLRVKKRLESQRAYADVRFAGGTTAGSNGTAIELGGACVIVAPCDRPQGVAFGAAYNLTAQGGGFFTVQLYDWTGGVAALKEAEQERIEATHPITSLGRKVGRTYHQDPHDDFRVMQVYFTLSRDVSPASSLQMGVPALDLEYAKTFAQVVDL
jgi:hypothetical protein